MQSSYFILQKGKNHDTMTKSYLSNTAASLLTDRTEIHEGGETHGQ